MLRHPQDGWTVAVLNRNSQFEGARLGREESPGSTGQSAR